MKLYELSSAAGANRPSKRIGRGPASGQGKTAGKGHKGQKARSGGSIRPGFEGGQMPLQRRIPKRGFNNIFATKYATVNVEALEKFEDGATVDAAALKDAGLISKTALRFSETETSKRSSPLRQLPFPNPQKLKLKRQAERQR